MQIYNEYKTDTSLWKAQGTFTPWPKRSRKSRYFLHRPVRMTQYVKEYKKSMRIQKRRQRNTIKDTSYRIQRLILLIERKHLDFNIITSISVTSEDQNINKIKNLSVKPIPDLNMVLRRHCTYFVLETHRSSVDPQVRYGYTYMYLKSLRLESTSPPHQSARLAKSASPVQSIFAPAPFGFSGRREKLNIYFGNISRIQVWQWRLRNSAGQI